MRVSASLTYDTATPELKSAMDRFVSAHDRAKDREKGVSLKGLANKYATARGAGDHTEANVVLGQMEAELSAQMEEPVKVVRQADTTKF